MSEARVDSTRATARTRPLLALREAALLGALYLGYTASRLLAADDHAAAQQVADHLFEAERLLGIAVEPLLNSWTASHVVLGVGAAYWYTVTHYAVTALVLLGTWLRRPEAYRTARTVLVASTLTALAFYLVVPVAPPRLLPGYVDVLAQTAEWGWWGESASAPRGLGSMTNQLAAMPSMHVGWAVWVALTLSRAVPARWRVAVWTYPLTTTLVVVMTANHWLLDAFAGAAVVLLVDRVVRARRRSSSDERQRGTPAETPHPSVEQ